MTVPVYTIDYRVHVVGKSSKETLLQRTLRLRALREKAAPQPEPTPDYPTYGIEDELLFGKYKFETVEWVLRADPGWLRWALENVRGFVVTDEVEEELRMLDDPRRPKAD